MSLDDRTIQHLRAREERTGLPPELVTDDWLRGHPHYAYVKLGLAQNDLKRAIVVSLPGRTFWRLADRLGRQPRNPQVRAWIKDADMRR
jgi:hypothetical protein